MHPHAVPAPQTEDLFLLMNNMCDGRHDDSDIWMFTDSSKRNNEMAVAWITMSSSGLVEDTKGIPVPGRYSIVKVEIMAIGLALADMRRKGGRKAVIFTDCQPALMNTLRTSSTSSH